MFGIRYETPEGTKVLWPNQLFFLLNEGLFDWKRQSEWGLTKELIMDKSKVDVAAKMIALLQALWFVSNAILRAAHRLPIAPLESMTLAYIPLFIVAYIYWWIKPKDIETPSVIRLPEVTVDQRTKFDAMTVSDAFDQEHKPGQDSYWQVWYLTPRVFEKEEQDMTMQTASHTSGKTFHEHLGHLEACEHPKCTKCQAWKKYSAKPTSEIVLAHWDPELYHSRLWPIICLFGVAFGALHLASWNTRFPTVIESWLWRSSAIVSMVTMLVFMQFEKVTVRWTDPLMIIKILLPFFYLLSRVILLIGAVAAFRASEPAIYETYDLLAYWVHLV